MRSMIPATPVIGSEKSQADPKRLRRARHPRRHHARREDALTSEPRIPHPDALHGEVASQIQRDHPNWLVMWGVYTRQYVAFPLFNAPKGTIARDPDPDQLVNRMRQMELPRRSRGGAHG